MVTQKVVIPAPDNALRGQAPAGIHGVSNYLKRVDSRFHGNDEKTLLQTFCEIVKSEKLICAE